MNKLAAYVNTFSIAISSRSGKLEFKPFHRGTKYISETFFHTQVLGATTPFSGSVFMRKFGRWLHVHMNDLTPFQKQQRSFPLFPAWKEKNSKLNTFGKTKSVLQIQVFPLSAFWRISFFIFFHPSFLSIYLHYVTSLYSSSKVQVYTYRTYARYYVRSTYKLTCHSKSEKKTDSMC